MQDIDLMGDFRVLLLEESPTHQALFEDWLSEIPTQVVSTPTDIPAQFDATVAVACLCQSALGEKSEEVRKQILTRNPYCQLVAIVPRSSFLSIYEDDYDACLQRPVLRDEFQQTIGDRMTWGVYSALLREFYDLNAKFLWLGRSETPEEIPDDIDVDQLQERYKQLCSRLDALQSKLSMENVEDISRSISLHKRYLTSPTQDADKGVESKYHPSRCPNCKLPWGVDHGNELGKGMISIGAGVWKCTRCSEVIHGLGEGGRRIMRG